MSERPPANIDLHAAARASLREHGFQPDFPPDVATELAALAAAHPNADAGVLDLRHLLWSSVDNDTSRDLDQAEVLERRADGSTIVRIAIADVDALVPKQSAIDRHAAIETTTVYTGVEMFPMLPEQLSTGLTSLLEDRDRLSVVTEFVVASDGTVNGGSAYRALIRNHAQLTYSGVGGWLEGSGPAPARVSASADLASQLKLQRDVGQVLRNDRDRHGALNIDTVEVRPILTDGKVTGITKQERNPATDFIEDFMIAANGVVARFLESQHVSSIRRVVRTPERWNRIVDLAAEHGEKLPPTPDAPALNGFLHRQHQLDPDHFPDLSLAIIKLLGPGEYVLERPGEPSSGHFGLAVQDYTHSTAPNRRFADLVTQRLLKAVIAGQPAPYSDEELADIARDCTLKQDAARKVEREMTKRITAVAMSHRIGEIFDAIVTGVTPKGTFVRVLAPHIEGLLAQGDHGVDVGDRIRVRLIRTDVERGYIDFARA